MDKNNYTLNKFDDTKKGIEAINMDTDRLS